MKKSINSMELKIPSKSINESFTRAVVASFTLQLDPTINELADIKTAVSEAVTNCIVHGYRDTQGIIYIKAEITGDNTLIIKIRDKGTGIPDIKQAMEPLFTTGGEERAGLGFAVMESFMDKVKVNSKEGKGTTVTLYKKIIRVNSKEQSNFENDNNCSKNKSPCTDKGANGEKDFQSDITQTLAKINMAGAL